METAIFIIATIILCFVCAYQANKAKEHKNAYDSLLKTFNELSASASKTLEKLKVEQKENLTLRKHLTEQGQAMELLQRTKFGENKK